MAAAEIIMITIILMLVLVLLGVHIGVALSLMSVLGIWLVVDNIEVAVSILSTTSFQAIREYAFGVIPLFVLMGLLMNMSNASSELYNAFHVLLRRVKGGLGIATVGANAVFATITGVSVASAAVFSKIALKPMLELKYDKKLALGTIAGSSILGMLIPPSLLLIIYGMLSDVSIGKMFVAGIIPGILLSLVYCIGIYTIARLKPEMAGGTGGFVPSGSNGWTKADLKMLFRPWAFGAVVVLMLGGLYGGFFTATEAGGVGVFGALLLVFLKRRFKGKAFLKILIETGYTSASILFLLIAAQMYSRMMSMSGVLNLINDFVISLDVAPIVVIFIFVLIMLILGTILDSTSILLICMPIMVPIVTALGYDLIWFGIVTVVAVEMGLLTPPFGLVVYAMKSALGSEATIEDIFRGSFPFLVMMFIMLLILIFVPSLSTWLPAMSQ